MSLQLVQSYDSDEDEARLRSAAFAQGGDSSDSSGSESDDAEDAETEEASRSGEDSGGKENAGGAATAGRTAGGAQAAGRIGGVRRTAVGFLPEKGPSGLPSAAAAFEAVGGPPSFLAPTALSHHMHIARAGKLVAMGSANEEAPRGIVSVAGAPAAAPAAVVYRERRAGGVGGGAAPAAVVYRERRAGGVGGGVREIVAALVRNRNSPAAAAAATAVLAREIVAAPVRNPNAPAAEPAAVEGGEEGAEGSDAANGDATRGRKAVGASMPPKADAVDLLRWVEVQSGANGLWLQGGKYGSLPSEADAVDLLRWVEVQSGARCMEGGVNAF
ncbi:unnamed protein product [Closterium sp. NIES-64]|nr:unnamed protein product [Closterium sp. NIES-64]